MERIDHKFQSVPMFFCCYALLILVPIVGVVNAPLSALLQACGRFWIDAMTVVGVQSFGLRVLPLVLVVAGCFVVNLVHPGWTSFRSLSRIAIDGIGLVIVSLVLQSDDLVIRAPGDLICLGLILAFVVDSITEACDLIRRACSRAFCTTIAGC